MSFQIEFPDFPVTDMPAMPEGFVDISWRNDACPFFENSATGYRLAVDYADPALREWPEGSVRFTLYPFNRDGMGDAIVETDDWSVMLAIIQDHDK